MVIICVNFGVLSVIVSVYNVVIFLFIGFLVIECDCVNKNVLLINLVVLFDWVVCDWI